MEEYKYLGCMENDQLNCARMVNSNVKTRVTTNVCMYVPTFCYETQHNQRLYTLSDGV